MQLVELVSTLTGQVLLKLALFGLVFIAPQITRAECECQTGSVEDAIRNADRIFRAELISAHISEDNSQAISFVVKVDDVIRGNTEKQYQLTTGLPDSCGVSVRLGFHDMYVLGPDETSVSSCAGSGRAVYTKYPILATAIALVDLPVSDIRGAQQLLNKQFHIRYDRATVDEFFELVERIDPTGNKVTGMANRIEYRGIAVYFKDDKYERVGEL